MTSSYRYCVMRPPFPIPLLLYTVSNEGFIGLNPKPLFIQNQLIVLFAQIYLQMDQTVEFNFIIIKRIGRNSIQISK
jgi:hypothetical protein